MQKQKNLPITEKYVDSTEYAKTQTNNVIIDQTDFQVRSLFDHFVLF